MEDIITLVGPRAVGKTTIGKELAYITGYEFIDLDVLMNEELKSDGGLLSFAEKYGWDVYMHRLHLFLKKLLRRLNGKKIILDLGGGTISSEFPISEKNAHLVKSHSKIFLILPYEEDDKNTRILVERELQRKRKNFWQGWNDEKIREKAIKDYFDRLPGFKRHAHHHIYTKEQSPRKVAKIIMKIAKIN
ncbi:MAG: hypothetical protein KKF46_08605 [Nanoarchaeota archaeon]|nr:hypothetical protein [Nanoarchaeota archaeon]MBU1322390.1 hypothetical protein [Nanoarchaeota archaeon]MBU1596935.1 hypothetical protein [Nanoarchaeota archaeon]MBU2442348.1 hypothetical protein [Nanoarchaeota archaeon]